MPEPVDPQGQPQLTAISPSLRARAIREEHARALLHITSVLADAVTAEEVHRAAVDQVAAALGASSAALWLREGRVLRLVRHVGARPELAEIGLEAAHSHSILDALGGSDPVRTTTQRTRMWCMPLPAESASLGVLVIAFDEEREPIDGERSLIAMIAHYATRALEQLGRVEAERRLRHRSDAIARRTLILDHASRAFGNPGLGHDQRLHTIAEEIATLIGAWTAISLVGDGGRLDSVASYHPDPEAGPLRANQPMGPAERVAVVPMRVQGRSIGTISAARVRAGQLFEAEDLELLEALADRAAAAIETSRLHRDAEAGRRRAEQLYRFADAAVHAGTLAEVYDAALAAACDALGARRAAILTADDDGVLRFRAWRGLSDAYRAALDGHSPWPQVGDAAPVLVADGLADPAWITYQAHFRAERIRAFGLVPLVRRGRSFGALAVYHDEPHPFTANELELASAIASHLASTIARFRAVAELERAVSENELFAGVLAHDLRNPLGAIVTAAQLALNQTERSSERAAKPLGYILSSAARMANMISQLLDFTRARIGGGIAIACGPSDLLDIARQAVAELELVHVDRAVELAADGDTRGQWDPDRLLQVISNLVGNACRHGAPTQPVSVRIDGRDPDAVTVTVHNGGAIPPAYLPRIFDPFRGREHRYTTSQGLGLGLYIVRELVRAHHGRVDVSSTERDGTTFVVRLPRG